MRPIIYIKKKKFISTNQIIVESFKKDEYEDIIKNKIELIFDFISSNSSSLVINNTEVIQVILTSDKISIEEQLRAGISPVDLGDCPEDIKEFYNISKEENLIILNQEKKNNNKKKKSSGNNNDNSINLGTFNQLEIYDFSGRKLNLSVCAKSITLLKYIGDVEEININSAKNYAEKGIDIFNASSDFFNDLCFQNKIDEGKDIIVKDRRTDIYQNISLCQNGCKYNGMNYNLMVANCICNSSSLQDGTNNGYDNNTEISQFKELVKSFLANLLDFNIEVIYCYNLVFYPPILKENIGFYFMILMNALQICCLSIFLFKKLKPIKYYLVQLKKIANPIKRKSKIKKRRNANINKEKSKENSERGINKSSTKELIKNKNNDNHKLNDESFNKKRIANIEVFKKK